MFPKIGTFFEILGIDHLSACTAQAGLYSRNVIFKKIRLPSSPLATPRQVRLQATPPASTRHVVLRTTPRQVGRVIYDKSVVVLIDAHEYEDLIENYSFIKENDLKKL